MSCYQVKAGFCLALLLFVFAFVAADGFASSGASPTMSPIRSVAPAMTRHITPIDQEGGRPRGKALNMLFDLSHSCYYTWGDPYSYYSSLISLAQSLGFTVTSADDFSNLMNYDVVLLMMPQETFTTADVTLIKNYLDAGKILWLFGEWGESYAWYNSYLNQLLVDLNAGIQIIDAEIVEPFDYDTYDEHILISNFSDHCLVEGLNEIIHPRAGYLEVDNPESALYYSTADSYILYESSTLGPFVMGAVPDPTRHPDWRLFVTADTNPFNTQDGYDFLLMYDDTAFAEKLLFWCGCQTDEDCNDGLWCNGVETCDYAAGLCLEGEPLCIEDGYWCNGEVTCDEVADQCVYGDSPCTDDGLWCNGDEECDEENDVCTHAGEPCFDDGLFCNGEETCVEESDECTHTGDPCEVNQTCNEDEDECRDAVVPPDDDLHADDTDDLTSDDESDPGWPEGKVTGGCCGE